MTELPPLWHDFVAAHPEHAGAQPEIDCFGDSPEMADELLDLVLHGPKRATAGDAGESIPRVGDLWIATDGQGMARAILRTTDMRVGRLDSVDDQFAYDEGEGDRSRDYWLDAHRGYFARVLPDVEDVDAMDTVFERFTVVWPPDVAD